MRIRKEELTEKQKKIISLGAFICFLLFCAFVTWFIGKPMIDFVSEPQKFRLWVEKSGILGKLAYILMVSIQVIVALIPGEPLEIGGGYAFGAIEGTFLCMAGTTLGSMVVFYLVRRFGMKLVEVFFSGKKIRRLEFLKDSRRRNILIFIVFFLPGTPKDLLTYFVGLTDIKFRHFFILASFARLPSIITSTLGGNALGGEKYISAVWVFAITLAVSGLGWVIYNLIQKRKK